MTIGIGLAILISTILYLIDRNHAWPQAWKIFKKLLKVAAVLFVVAAIGTGIIVALDARKEAIERHQIEATKAREQAAEDKAAKEAEAYRLAHEVDAQAATMEEERKSREQAGQTQAQARARKEEHARRISQIKISIIPDAVIIPSTGYHVPAIRALNGTPETISSITFGTRPASSPDEQPQYYKVEVHIEPGKYVLVGPNTEACEKLETSVYRCVGVNIGGGAFPGDQATSPLEKVFVKDYEGTR